MFESIYGLKFKDRCCYDSMMEIRAIIRNSGKCNDIDDTVLVSMLIKDPVSPTISWFLSTTFNILKYDWNGLYNAMTACKRIAVGSIYSICRNRYAYHELEGDPKVARFWIGMIHVFHQSLPGGIHHDSSCFVRSVH